VIDAERAGFSLSDFVRAEVKEEKDMGKSRRE
jgi:hypothetical protein